MAVASPNFAYVSGSRTGPERHDDAWSPDHAAGLLLMAPISDGSFKILCLRRSDWTKRGGSISIPFGAVEHHEKLESGCPDYIGAMLRELGEEIGISYRGKLYHLTDYRTPDGGGIRRTYVGVVDAPFDIQPHLIGKDQEHCGYCWVDPLKEEIPGEIHPGFAFTMHHRLTIPTLMLIAKKPEIEPSRVRWQRSIWASQMRTGAEARPPQLLAA